jgi:ClpP class serine protease
MTRENVLNSRYLAMESGFIHTALQTASINIHLAKMEEPKVEFVAAENSYSPGELDYYFGIATERQKSGLVAIIPVKGSLSPEWTWAGTNTEWLSSQINIALGNTAVSSIILRCNSGGGTVSGTMAAAMTVKEANKQKPVLGHGLGMVGSAAYWILSQTGEFYIESGVSSAVGSIGVMGVYASNAEQLQKEGIDVRVLRSKGSEDKNLLHPAEPINEEALKDEQKLIDSMRVEFWNAVKTARPQITTDPGGRLYYGREAIKAGLANEVATLNDVIKRADFLARKRASTV